LSKNARKWFEFEKETVRTEAPDPDRKEQLSHQDMLEKCKTETPRTILSILSSGKPSVAELNVVERLIENYDLPIEAINFLLVYVIGNLGEFPSYNYFDKVAVEWQRHQVKTAEDALEVVRKRAKRLAQSKRSHEKNTIPQDIESDWFDEYWKNR
jgi:replication initiation and membrane attachment protein